jgi:hypothetical protein
MIMPTQQIQRVKLTLNKYMSTWDGKVLRYLHDHHPGKKNGTGTVMDFLSAAWLPFAMRFFGASDAECKEAAVYSARFLLSHACSIVSEFGLPNVAMQGLVGESIPHDYSVRGSPSPFNANNVVATNSDHTNNVVVTQDELLEEEEEDTGDDGFDDEFYETLSFSGLDAGFRT